MAYKRTLEIAQYLSEHPDIVARIFAMNAKGRSTYNLHEDINKLYGNSNGYIPVTSTTVRKLLHHRRPFDHPALYSKVNPDDEAKVKLRFKKQIKPKVKANGKASSPITKEHLPLLYDVLEARMAYEDTLADAVAAGLSRKSVIAWCSMVSEGSLIKDKDDV